MSRLAVYGHDGRGGIDKGHGHVENRGTHGSPGTSAAFTCVLCEMPVRIPKAGPVPRYCRRCRELGRSLRRARALARLAGSEAVLHHVNAALAAYVAAR